MKRTAVEKIAALATAVDRNCPCKCQAACVEPFEHPGCMGCWITLIEVVCSLEESWSAESHAKLRAEALAYAIWAVLVAVCGADPGGQEDFVWHVSRGPLPEYRFQGSLGFGGKVHIENPPRVSCYSEDENQERRMMIDGANRLLVAIARLWQSTSTGG